MNEPNEMNEILVKHVCQAIGTVLECDGVPGRVITSEVALRDLGMDSARLIELAGVLEEYFHVEVSDRDLQEVTTVADIARLVAVAVRM